MFLDFNEIKANNPIEQVAERLGLKLKKSGAQLRGQCPSGEGDDRGFVLTPSKGVWFSFPQQKGGDAIALVSFVRDLPPKEAAAWIVGKQPEKTEKPETAEGFKPLDYLAFEHEAVQALGFDASDAEKIGLGYSPRGIFRGRVAVPIRLSSGRLIGYIAIQDCELPKEWRW